MKKLITLIFSIFCLIGCNDAPAAPSPSGPIDLATLPKSIDVQTAAAIQDNDDVVLIDVREQHEYDAGHIPGITLIPMSEMESRVSEIPTDKTVVLTCQSGRRSAQIYDWLTQNGYDNVHNMQGGFVGWQAAGLAVE